MMKTIQRVKEKDTRKPSSKTSAITLQACENLIEKIMIFTKPNFPLFFVSLENLNEVRFQTQTRVSHFITHSLPKFMIGNLFHYLRNLTHTMQKSNTILGFFSLNPTKVCNLMQSFHWKIKNPTGRFKNSFRSVRENRTFRSPKFQEKILFKNSDKSCRFFWRNC